MSTDDAPEGALPLHLGVLRRLKWWVWFTEIARPSDLQTTLAWAGIIGFGGALTSIGFRYATSLLHKLMTGSQEPGLVESFAALPWWWRLTIPAVGGLLGGVVLYLGMRWRGGVTTSDYMEAVVLGDGKISTRRSLVKCLSAAFTVASGGSIGREGPLVQLASLVASIAGRLRHWSTPRLRLLVGCGAAAGIASAYNAPIAGALFVAEIVLGSVAMEIFGPLVFSSVVATLTIRGFLGADPIYAIPHFSLHSNWEVVPYLLLGLLAGLVAPWFLRLLNLSERLAGRIRVPVYLKMCVGGLIVGALAIIHPEVCGNGYSAVNTILAGGWAWQIVAAVLICKVLATAATFGSGAVGGVFTPTLFVGASLGYLFGIAALHFPVGLTINPSAFAIVGMGAFLAATTHAPIMAIIMIFELTLDYQIILPLMLACVVGYYTSVGFEKRSIYSEALKRKGAGDYRHQLAELHVRDLMKPDPLSVSPTARFAEIGEKFIANRFNYLYVTEGEGRFIGAISLHDIKNYLNAPELAELVIAGDILREDIPIIHPSASLNEALERFARHLGERLPVVSDHEGSLLVGSLAKTDVILALAGSARPGANRTLPPSLTPNEA
ncbi:MAG: ClcB-like voltage-gated chloride channel protein [Chthoniobacterales bacterium]|nr:ClcB-like voltage-gated chloride channel protein [Chthoniobacterales bacterium]